MAAERKMTVQEALAEIKLIKAKIEKKKQALSNRNTLFYYDKIMPKPDINAGAELQAIEDLYKDLELIRCTIMKANVTTMLCINGVEKPIYAWLVWKKEIALLLQQLYGGLNAIINRAKTDVSDRPPVFKDKETDKPIIAEAVFTLSDKDILKKEEEISALIEKVDGAISMKNATTEISF